MGKAVNSAVLDASLNKIATSVKQTVTSAEPANFAGISAVKLADKTIGSGDFTLANGTATGARKVTVGQQSTISITASGTATHVCYDDGTTLLAVTTCTSQALTSGGTVTVPAHAFEATQPT